MDYSGPKNEESTVYIISWQTYNDEDHTVEEAARRADVDLKTYETMAAPTGYPRNTLCFRKKGNKLLEIVVFDVEGSKSLKIGWNML